jgi:hypothetical protein
VQCSAGRRRATATATATARRHVTSHVVAPAATCPARRRSRSATTATRHGAFASRPAFGHPDTRAAHASARSLARSPSASSQFRAPGVHAMRATQVLIAAARQLRPSSRCVFCGVRGLYIAGAHIFLWAGFSSDNNVEKRQHVTLHPSSCWGYAGLLACVAKLGFGQSRGTKKCAGVVSARHVPWPVGAASWVYVVAENFCPPPNLFSWTSDPTLDISFLIIHALTLGVRVQAYMQHDTPSARSPLRVARLSPGAFKRSSTCIYGLLRVYDDHISARNLSPTSRRDTAGYPSGTTNAIRMWW